MDNATVWVVSIAAGRGADNTRICRYAGDVPLTALETLIGQHTEQGAR